MSLFCVLISLQSSEEEEGCLCEDAGLEKGHVDTGLSDPTECDTESGVGRALKVTVQCLLINNL